jgi:hypothetical protein
LAMYLDFSNIQIADFKYAKIRPTSRWNMAALGRFDGPHRSIVSW